MDDDGDGDDDDEHNPYHLPPPHIREQRVKRLRQSIRATYAQMMEDVQPAKCAWLSREKFVLPAVVNIVYSVDFSSPCIASSLDLIRIANQLPNSKYRLPNFPSIAIKLHPTTATLFAKLNVELVKTTTPGMALFFSHIYRQLLERLSLILYDEDTKQTYVGTLEGYLGMSTGVIHNVVGNGVLPQDGVHLMNLLHATEDKSDHDPENFPNLIHQCELSNGRMFTANIANTAKIVLMGLKCVEDVHEAYKIMCNKVHQYDDPNVPLDAHERWKYRRRQLQKDPAFRGTTEQGGIRDDDDDDNDDHNGNDDEDKNDIIVDSDNNSKITSKSLFETAAASSSSSSDQGTPLSNTGMSSMFGGSGGGGGGNHADDDDKEEEEEPLLWQAAKAGQVENVIMLLKDVDLACPYPETDPLNDALIRELQEMPDTETRTYALIINHLRQWSRQKSVSRKNAAVVVVEIIDDCDDDDNDCG